ncbi:MAG: sulfite exporter TauE/SafE family protein [Alphaproteobacteria bacterium]|nr:sulfite exporter TauE/SafE family protein [Alphaproteobacteria bacterium]
MNFELIQSIGPTLMFAAVALALFAGFVKGTVGFALPMIMISGLASFLPPDVALAGLIVPAVVANLWQALRNGPVAAMASARVHWRFLMILLGFIAASAQLVAVLPASVLFLILGVPVSTFALIQLIGWRPRIDARNRRPVEMGAGALAGFLGGISGVWGPPLVLYLTALSTPKAEQMRVQGVVYSAGAIMLVLAHLKSGVLTAPSVTLSSALLFPALMGLYIGFRVQDHMDQDKFRKMTLLVLVVAGLNLIRRGLMG